MPIPIHVKTIEAAPGVPERRIYEYQMDTSVYLDRKFSDDEGYARRVAAGRLQHIRDSYGSAA